MPQDKLPTELFPELPEGFEYDPKIPVGTQPKLVIVGDHKTGSMRELLIEMAKIGVRLEDVEFKSDNGSDNTPDASVIDQFYKTNFVEPSAPKNREERRREKRNNNSRVTRSR